VRFFKPNIDKLRQKRDVTGLIAALQDPEREIQVNTAEALGLLKDPQALEPLIAALLQGETVVRGEVARALGRIGGPRAVTALTMVLADPEPYIHYRVVEALREIGPEAVDPLMVAVLVGSDVTLRQRAAEVLGEIGDARAIPALIVALGDKKPTVCSAVMRVLQHMGMAALPALVAAAKGQESARREQVRQVVVGLCGATADLALAVDTLIHALAVERDEQLLRDFAPLLSRLGEVVIAPLVQVLHGQDATLRLWAFRLLEGAGWQPATEADQAAYCWAQEAWEQFSVWGVLNLQQEAVE
jgi:HEAT repeat protein